MPQIFLEEKTCAVQQMAAEKEKKRKKKEREWTKKEKRPQTDVFLQKRNGEWAI